MREEKPKIARVGQGSPWGEIQQSRHIGENMYMVSTSSHGGVILTDQNLRLKVQNKIGDRFGRDVPFCPNFLGKWEYWEEDCDAPFIIDLLRESLRDDEIKQSEIDSDRFQKIVKWTRQSYCDKFYPPIDVVV